MVQDPANASCTLLYGLRSGQWDFDLVEGPVSTPASYRPSFPRPTSTVPSGPRPPRSSACLLVAASRSAPATSTPRRSSRASPGVVVDVTGTAEPVAVTSTEVVLDELRLVETHAHAVAKMLLIENPGFVSGGSTSWWARAQSMPESEVFTHAALAPPGSEGTVPAHAVGAAAPRWNDRMRGSFAGLGLHHERAHPARAILEGCAFALRDIIDRFDAMGLGGEELRVVGGGARSRLWLQIKADVTGHPMRAVQGDHATSAGAAMLAGVAAGFFADLDEAAARIVRLAHQPVYPNAARGEVYEEGSLLRRLFDGVGGVIVISAAARVTRSPRVTPSWVTRLLNILGRGTPSPRKAPVARRAGWRESLLGELASLILEPGSRSPPKRTTWPSGSGVICSTIREAVRDLWHAGHPVGHHGSGTHATSWPRTRHPLETTVPATLR